MGQVGWSVAVIVGLVSSTMNSMGAALATRTAMLALLSVQAIAIKYELGTTPWEVRTTFHSFYNLFLEICDPTCESCSGVLST